MSNFVETTRQGLGSRGKDSIGGAIFGVVLVALGCVLLFWNEGRAVRRYQDLKEGAAAFVNGDSAIVDPADEGALIHLSGEALTAAPLLDSEFGVSETAIKLNRSVEMYQWVEEVDTEEKKKVGGSVETTKTYSYSQEWRSGPVDSSQFKVSGEHQNPGALPFQSASYQADDVKLGAFRLPAFLVSQIGGSESLDVTGLDMASDSVKNSAQLHAGGFYIGNSPASPSVGDVKIIFSIVRPGPISVVAQQSGDTLVQYRTKNGGAVDLLEIGIIPAAEMFKMAQDRNKFMTWAIRIFGFVLLGIAFSMIFRPIAVLADILPFLGRIVGAGTTFIAFILAGILWTLTVAIAWIFYRPILGISILLVAIGLIVLFVRKLRQVDAGEPEVETAPPLDGPPPLT
tara:strand:- start:91 stop:1287 length:1197 start_codon:yes stop_codon:yes gene_type:complete